MPCYYPIDGWRSARPNERGRYTVVFKRSEAQQDEPVRLPCGRCIGCRLDRSREWALRCMHESLMHEENSFITLTFADEHMPLNGSIDQADVQLFIKRLRERIYPKRISYFACGEYGDQLGRPHYHALIFGHDFPDKKILSRNENPLYTSDSLSEVWPYGIHSIGEVSFQTAAYTARYSMKKISGEKAEEHYKGKKPEFLLSSKRPAIGKRWFEKYQGDCMKGYLTHKGQKYPLPKYYEKLFQEADDYSYTMYKAEKAKHFDPMDIEQTGNRLRVREEVKKIRTSNLNRSLHNV